MCGKGSGNPCFNRYSQVNALPFLLFQITLFHFISTIIMIVVKKYNCFLFAEEEVELS